MTPVTSPKPLLALTATCLLVPALAMAHVGQGDIGGGFLSGLAHPVMGPDHVIAMIAVGMWGAQLGAPAIWLLPVTFPVVMAFGGVSFLYRRFLGCSVLLRHDGCQPRLR